MIKALRHCSEKRFDGQIDQMLSQYQSGSLSSYDLGWKIIKIMDANNETCANAKSIESYSMPRIYRGVYCDKNGLDRKIAEQKQDAKSTSVSASAIDQNKSEVIKNIKKYCRSNATELIKYYKNSFTTPEQGRCSITQYDRLVNTQTQKFINGDMDVFTYRNKLSQLEAMIETTCPNYKELNEHLDKLSSYTIFCTEQGLNRTIDLQIILSELQRSQQIPGGMLNVDEDIRENCGAQAGKWQRYYKDTFNSRVERFKQNSDLLINHIDVKKIKSLQQKQKR